MSEVFGHDAQARKDCPVYSGCFMYFPKALAEVARLSKIGNDQHNPGEPLHWAREKSGDELDSLARHLIDGDHAHIAWRALANLEKQIEAGWSLEGPHEEKDTTHTNSSGKEGSCSGGNEATRPQGIDSLGAELQVHEANVQQTIRRRKEELARRDEKVSE